MPKQKIKEWLNRYLPAEIIGTITAVSAASITHYFSKNLIFIAYIGSLGEAIGFYATILIQNVLIESKNAKIENRIFSFLDFTRIIVRVVIEFGPAGIIDGLVLRPFFMYLFPVVLENFALGIFIGKLAGDFTFYFLVIISYEIKKYIKNGDISTNGTKTKHKNIFNEIEDIGVIWVMDEAAKLGFYPGNPQWVNLGQGEPEVGEIKGAPARINEFHIEPNDDRYGPLNGMEALRKTIADYYNRLYRKNKSSKYTADNVSIAMGGRLALTRIFTALGKIRLGYKIPEYPAYEDMLNYQLGKITPVCVPTKKENNYSIPFEEFEEAIEKLKLDAFLFSNPCNPTGHVIKGEELKAYIKIAREQNCTLIVDEIYSHFIYENGKAGASPVSTAEFIEDVNSDPVLIVDGLTKSFRYPGWRLAWILGSKHVIENLGRAASGIDGGPSLPIQRAALKLLEPERANMETCALREVFSKKQSLMLNSLRENGLICSSDANSTFYIWADISQLPIPLNNCNSFFKEALKYKVITVPGCMFDIHPGIDKKKSKFDQFVRFSFGPTEENLRIGLEQVTKLIKSLR